MKKSLSFIFAALGLVLVLALTLPMMISWDQYKELVEKQFSATTGRALHINGALHFALLPTPGATLNDVVIDNPPGTLSKNFATVKTLDVGVALRPLLSKQIRITHIDVTEPAVTLETLSNGTNNWSFAPKAAPSTDQTTANAASGSTQNLSIDSLNIRNGFVRIVNVPQKSQKTLGPFEGNFKIESLQGPFSGRGKVTLSPKMSLRFEASTEALPDDTAAPIPFKASLYLPGNIGSGEFKGTVTRAPSLKVQADSVLATKYLDKIVSTLPDFLSPNTHVTGALEYQNNQLHMNNLSLHSGGTEVSGSLALDIQQRPRITIDLARMALPPQSSNGQTSTSSKSEQKTLADQLASGFAETTALLDKNIPVNALDIVLTASQLALPGQPALRDVRVAASLDPAAVTLQTLDLKTGDTVIHLKGALPRQKDGTFASADLQAQITKRDIQVNTTARLTRDTLRLEPMTVMQKGESLAGSVLYAPKNQPALQVALKGSALDLDTLLGKKSNTVTKKEATNDTAAASDPLDALQGLQAKISAAIGRLTYKGQAAQNVDVQAEINSKGLEITTARIGDLGGMVVTASGHAAGLSPLEGVALDINGKTPDLSATLRALGNEQAKNLGASQFTAAIKGNAKALSILLDGTIDQGKVTLQATRSGDQITGTIHATHPETATIVRNFAHMNPTASFGPFGLKAQFAKGPQTLQAKDLVVELGTAGTVHGDLDIRPGDSTRTINGTLKADTLNLAALNGDRATADNTPATTQADSTARQWSQQPLDLEALRDLKGRISVDINKLLVKKFIIDDFKTAVHFADNTITLDKLSGKFFDAGSFNSTGQITIAPTGQAHRGQVSLSIDDTDAKKLFLALGSTVFEKGTITATQKLSFNGASEAQLIGSLNGGGQIAIADAIINGIDLDALAEKLYKPNSLSDFAALLDQARAGGQTPIGNVTIPLTVQSGIVQVQETPIKTAKTAMATKGLVNLPSKTVDMMGQITFVEQKNLPPLTLFIKGPISAPQKSFDTRSFTQFYAQKATEKLQNKLEDKLQNKLNKVLGVPETPAAQTPPAETLPADTTGAATPADTTQPAAPAMPQPKPKDQLKDLGTQMLNNLLNGGMQ